MIILGTNSIKDTGFNVANSLRLNDDDSAYLNRTLSGSGNAKKFTISFWQKLGTGFDADRAVISGGADSNNYLVVRNQSTQGIQILETASGSDHTNLITNRKFRDVSAWYHIVVAVDTTQGTDTNRVKLYVNGTQETSFSTATYPGQNDDLQFNNNTAHAIGRRQPQANLYMDGYLAEFVFVDDQQLDATSFGEFDEDSGIWKPKNVSGLTFGTNGFYLDFEDSSALGNDVSGNDNDFTVNNLTAIDQSTDTCTNNYAVLNPLYAPSGGFPVLSQGNLQMDDARSGEEDCTAHSTIAIPHTGKWYYEIKVLDSDYSFLGLSSNNTAGTKRLTYYGNSGKYYSNSSNASYGATYGDGDIVSVAVDIANNSVTFYKNGSSQGAISYTFDSSLDYFAHVGNGSGTNDSFAINFGAPPYAISSGNSDANGYGNFEYAVPSGYYALNTKNLAEYG